MNLASGGAGGSDGSCFIIVTVAAAVVLVLVTAAEVWRAEGGCGRRKEGKYILSRLRACLYTPRHAEPRGAMHGVGEEEKGGRMV